MVCGKEPYCVYQLTPQCDCDWNTGECKDESMPKRLLSELKLELPAPPLTKNEFEFDKDDMLLIRELIQRHKTSRKDKKESTLVETYAVEIHIGFTILTIFCICLLTWIILKIKEDLKKTRDIESIKDQ
jgi:hypothetical protein